MSAGERRCREEQIPPYPSLNGKGSKSARFNENNNYFNNFFKYPE